MTETKDAAWRRKAQECRLLAARMEDPKAQTTMLDIANSYEKLAAYEEATDAAVKLAFGRRAKPK